MAKSIKLSSSFLLASDINQKNINKRDKMSYKNIEIIDEATLSSEENILCTSRERHCILWARELRFMK
jgi:hypothetical protein